MNTASGSTALTTNSPASTISEILRSTHRLARTYALSREDAYVLSSLCVDLKISEIVDAGEFVVSAVLPLAVFTH